MKLLLTSGGLMNQSMIKALDNLVGLPRSQFKIAFIPTAANVEAGDKASWLIKDFEIFCDLQPEEFDIVDISAVPQDIWLPRLQSANILVFGGGNTFHLMYWIQKSGLKDLLTDLLTSRVYIGISAGSIVAGSSIKLSSDPRSYSSSIGDITNDLGLKLLDCAIIPHLNSPHFSPARDQEYAKKLSAKASTQVYALDDQSAIKIDGDKMEIISEGEYLVFNSSKS